MEREGIMFIPHTIPNHNVEKVALSVIIVVCIVGLALSARKPWGIM